MNLNKIVYIFPIIISGCSGTMPTKIVEQIVEIPISVPCKEEIPAEPLFCFDTLSKSTDIYEKTKCLLSDRSLSKGYEIELLSKLKACK